MNYKTTNKYFTQKNTVMYVGIGIAVLGVIFAWLWWWMFGAAIIAVGIACIIINREGLVKGEEVDAELAKKTAEFEEETIKSYNIVRSSASIISFSDYVFEGENAASMCKGTDGKFRPKRAISTCLFTTDGKLNRNGICFETFLHHFDYTIEVRAVYVHLVDISHSRDSVFVSLTPYGFRLRLNTAFGTEYRYGTVQNSERTLNLDREVNVSGRVYDVDSVSFPETSGGSGGNCDTSLLLLLHPVHGGRAVMGFAKLVCLTGVIKNSFGGSRFAGVDVSHDTNISRVFKRIFSWHV